MKKLLLCMGAISLVAAACSDDDSPKECVAGASFTQACGEYGEGTRLVVCVDNMWDESNACEEEGDACVEAFGVTCRSFEEGSFTATDTGDALGYSVAIEGDTLVVGAPFESSDASSEEDNSAQYSGAVYVFTRKDSEWSQQAYLKASNTDTAEEAQDQFGFSVALANDTLVVGAPYESSGNSADETDNTAEDSGAVYVFARTGEEWSQQAYIKASNITAGDHFGWSVALNGGTLAVGAPLESSSATGVDSEEPDNEDAEYSGAVYLFTADAEGEWSEQSYIKASNTDVDDNFGWSVALTENTLAVGAIGESSTSTGTHSGGVEENNDAEASGAVYVFSYDDLWKQTAYIKASNTGEGDGFGSSIDLDGTNLAVGAPGEASNAAGVNNGEGDNDEALGSGAVYVYTFADDAWSQQAYIKASNPDAQDWFGSSVALSGTNLFVGAPDEDSASDQVNLGQEDGDAEDSGAIYAFRYVDESWSQVAYIKTADTENDMTMGYSIAATGTTLAFGATGSDTVYIRKYVADDQ